MTQTDVSALFPRFSMIDDRHKQYKNLSYYFFFLPQKGKLVRIAPNHISVAEPEALQIVYAVRPFSFRARSN